MSALQQQDKRCSDRPPTTRRLVDSASQGRAATTTTTTNSAAPCNLLTDLLPSELLVGILSHVEIKEIPKVATVCKKLHSAANDESLWEKIATRRYGGRVTQSTKCLYNDSFKQMVIDDNKRGALPTLNGVWKSAWHDNSPQAFYCCLILSIKWHRPSNMLWIYLDARGSGFGGLRRPETSGVWLRDPETRRVVKLEDRIHPNPDGSYNMQDLMGIPRNVNPYTFVPDPHAARRDDRCKGVLQIDASLFSRAGSYEFCYANATPSFYRDYQECTLFTLETENSLSEAFDSFSLQGDSPFALDNEATCKERWKPHLNVYNTKNRLGPWPECIGMTGEEAKNYIQAQNPDLHVTVFHRNEPMNLYYGDSEVRFWVNDHGRVTSAPSRG